jgi:predicted  nucleic acid-binding Zn-ribbon protein
MAKIFSVLTLLVALAATFFGFQSKELIGKLKDTADREHTDLLATKDNLKKADAKVKTAEEDVKTATDALSMAKVELSQAKDSVTKAQGDLKDAVAAKTKAEDDLATIKKSYDDLKAFFGPKTPEEITKEITDMKAKIPELDAKVAAAEKQVADLTTEKGTLEARTKDAEAKAASSVTVIKHYKEGFMQKGLTGRVLAVNAGWGFCVLSIGDRQGAAASKIMIVVRGGQAIGKVKIMNVENSQSVADIIASSFARGTYVEPGDEVIFTGEDKVREEPAEAKTPIGPALPGVPELPKRD